MIARFFVDRPIFATVISVVFVLAGGVAVFTLPVAQYPEVTPPTVLVTALYPGANALTVQDTVAAPIEEQVSGVEGMMYMSSRCTNDGAYNLTVTFKLGMDSDMAQVLVQNRVVAGAAGHPGPGAERGHQRPKMSPNTLMIVNLVSPDGRYDELFLSNYATINVKDELGRLPGVAGITYLGQRNYSLRVWLDPDKMAALDLSAMDVVTAIAQQNVQVAAGQIGQQPVPKGAAIPADHQHAGPAHRSGAVRQHHPQGWSSGSTLGAILLGNLRPVRPGQGRPVPQAAQPAASATPSARRRAAARRGPRRTGSQQYDQSCTLDGQPSVALSIYQLPGSNALQTASGVYAKMKELKTPFSRRAGLRDRLRHDALHPRVGQRGLLHAARRRDPGGHRRAGVPAGLEGDDPADDRRAGLADRHLRDHGAPGLHAQQLDAVRPGAGDRHRRGRRHRRAGKHRAADRHRPGCPDRHDQGHGRDHRPGAGHHARARARCSFPAASWAASAVSSSASSR